MPSIYQHDYNTLSIYGNVVALLREHGAQGGVHLDIGCGYGAIAEPVRDELGLSYIGFDLADDGLESLRDRGFETHRIDLSDLDGFATIVRKAIANRPIASLTFIDTLEHIINGQEVLAALRQIAEPTGAPLVLSVPNVTHKDLALKLLLGRWDVTEDGLLDHTHVTLYSHERLVRLMQTVGWRKAATRDWSLYQSDQYFPLSTPLLNRYLPAGQFLHELINRANPHALVNQFVRLYHVDEPRPRPLLVERGEPTGPFLSVLIDSAKDGLDRLKVLARGLEMQSSGDFEVVILHPPSVSTEELSDGPLAGLPSVGARARFVPNPGGSRAAALNAAVERSSGRYFAVLDDAGEVAPRWVESLIELSERLPGSVLQVNRSDMNGIAPGPQCGSTPLPEFFRFVREKHGPFATLAIPASAFHQLGLRFELELPDGKGWDLAIDAILHCGLSTSPVMSVAPLANGSGDTVGADLFATDDISLLKKLNDRPLLLPIGATERIQALADAHARATERIQADAYARERLVRSRPLLNQLVSAYSAPLAGDGVEAAAAMQDRPFLSVITRTQGIRPYTLRDTLMSLGGQSSQDFEVVIVVHSDREAIVESVREMASSFPPSLRDRINVINCTRPGRSSPLNDGIRQAKGRYIAVLDDDDIALGHWVETFQKLAADAPGAVLRSNCVRQNFELTTAGDLPLHPRAISWFDLEWPTTYDPVVHLHRNLTPPMCLAYPAGVFREDGIEFDESVNTAEDWDLLSRASMLRGVVTTPEITAIYCWGRTTASSLDIHPQHEWLTNLHRTRNKLDSQPVLLPAGSVSRIVSLIDEKLALVQNNARLEEQIGQLEPAYRDLEDAYRDVDRAYRDLQRSYDDVDRAYRSAEEEKLALVQNIRRLEQQIGELGRTYQSAEEENLALIESNKWLACHLAPIGGLPPWFPENSELSEISRQVLVNLLTSTSWRVVRPLRRIMGWLARRPAGDLTVDRIPSSLAERQSLIRDARQSTSWRISFPIRVIGRLVRGRT